MTHKLTIADENSIDALNSGPSCHERAEKCAGQEGVEWLIRGLYYFNDCDLNGCTDNGDLVGSWIGQQGHGAQTDSNNWFNARTRTQSNCRHPKVGQRHIPGGGTLPDAGVRGDYRARSNLGLSASVQYGHWLFPVILPNTQRNVTARVQILFHLERLFHRCCTNATRSASGNGGRS